MIRWLYSLAVWFAQPLLRRKLARRGVVEPGYLKDIDERFGYYSRNLDSMLESCAVEDPLTRAGTTFQDGGYVWVHAVSLGETRAAGALVVALRKAVPGMRLLLTHGTATGRAEGETLLLPGDVQVWQPWDTTGAVGRFLRQFRPAVCVLMETEVWPNLVAGCKLYGVPVVLVNARLNSASFRRAARLGWLARPAYSALNAVYAQTEGDAARLRQLGAPVAGVFGNLKFDATPNAAQLQQGRDWRTAVGRPVVALASSREGEEQQLVQVLLDLRAFAGVKPTKIAMKSEVHGGVGTATKPVLPPTSIQWLVVPRHPQRFEEVAQLLKRAGFTVSRRSSWSDSSPPQADVWLGDSVGEMALYYGLADVALLGGSFTPVGGQNLIEAASCGCPVVMGPSVFNFADAAALAESAEAARFADTLQKAASDAVVLAHNAKERQRMSANAYSFAAEHRGAAQRTALAVVQACRLV